jgi:GH18 family chitinase
MLDAGASWVNLMSYDLHGEISTVNGAPTGTNATQESGIKTILLGATFMATPT